MVLISIYHILTLIPALTAVCYLIDMIPLTTFATLYHKIPSIKTPLSLNTILHSFVSLCAVVNQTLNPKNTRINDQGHQNYQNLYFYDSNVHLILFF